MVSRKAEGTDGRADGLVPSKTDRSGGRINEDQDSRLRQQWQVPSPRLTRSRLQAEATWARIWRPLEGARR